MYLLFGDFSNFKTSVCQKLNLIKQELSDVKQITNKRDSRSYNDKTCLRKRLMRKNIVSKQQLLFVARTTQQIIIEKLLDNILSNSEKVKTVKHISEN